MSEQYILALDAGTTSSRSIIFDKSGKMISMAQKEFTQIYPKPGWVEHDPEEIWSTQAGTIAEAITKAEIDPADIAAIGITNQRETTVVWDKETGKPVYNAIVWQCRRTSDMCLGLAKYKDMIHEKTGLILDPYFSATKIRWILDNVEGANELAKEGRLLFGTIETWLVYKLTGGAVHVTDPSNASRTMLFNIHTLSWDDNLLNLLDIPRSMLPQVKSNSEIYGETSVPFLKKNVPISGMAGDQQAALFGHLCVSKAQAKNTYGTGCFLLSNTGNEAVLSDKGLVTTVAWNIKGITTYALEGSVFVGGAVIQWLRDELGLISNAAQSEDFALQVEDTCGCYVVPAFAGLGAPYWDPCARGVITGLTRGVNRYHIVRAALDAICYQVDDVLRSMGSELGTSIESLHVDGGACVNNYLMQRQSDLSNVCIDRPVSVESTARGAAYLAGLAVGFWQDIDAIKKCIASDRIFSPHMNEEERETLRLGWKDAVKRAMSDI